MISKLCAREFEESDSVCAFFGDLEFAPAPFGFGAFGPGVFTPFGGVPVNVRLVVYGNGLLGACVMMNVRLSESRSCLIRVKLFWPGLVIIPAPSTYAPSTALSGSSARTW